MTRTLVLLVITAQLADLALFGLAVRAQGIGGESGIGLIAPMVPLYEWGGFGAVAVAKLAATGAVLTILALLHWRQRPDWRVTPRGVALLVATLGVFGAATALVAIL